MATTATTEAGWQISESGPEAYERYLVPRFFAPWADHLVGLADLEPGVSVIDVACGTGIVARTAADVVGGDGSVLGVDINPAMLEAAERFASEAGAEVEWRQGDAADLPAEDASFNAALCQQALQFLPDPAVALREMRRVLAPGGRLGLAVLRPLEHNPSYAPLADALERHLGGEAGEMMRSPFPGWSGDHLRGLVEDAGFADVTLHLDIRAVRYPSPGEFLIQEAASSPMAGRVAELDMQMMSAIVDELERDLERWVDDDGLVFPMETYMLTGRR